VPAVAVAGLALITARSATAATVTVAVELLLFGFGSVASLVTEAVLPMVEPSGALDSTCTTIVKVPLAPTANDGADSVTVPVPPTGGVTAVNPAG